MKITAPYGYDEIVPLQKTHRVLKTGATPAFCRNLNAIALSLAEFGSAARDYPIVFASLDRGKSFAPVAVLGLAQGSNLFLDASGAWVPDAYVPAFVRRYPFCLSKLYVDGRPHGERVVCVAKAQIGEGGVALFDAQGNPAPEWQAAERLLAGYEADLDRTALLCGSLAGMQLLEPFTAQQIGGEAKLSGMYRVAAAKLKDLEPASHKALAEQGFAGPIYAHLQSLENFSRLAARRASHRTGSGRG